MSTAYFIIGTLLIWSSCKPATRNIVGMAFLTLWLVEAYL